MRNTLFLTLFLVACGGNPPLVSTEPDPTEDPPEIVADPPVVGPIEKVFVFPTIDVPAEADAGAPVEVVDAGSPEVDAGEPVVEDAGTPDQPIQCTRGKGKKLGLYKNGTCQ